MDPRERRVYERVPFFRPVDLSVPPDAPSIEARSFDVSLGGVGLAVPAGRAVPVGTAVAVTFHLTDRRRGAFDERILGRVVHARSEADCTRVGIEFAEPVHPSAYPGLSRVIGQL